VQIGEEKREKGRGGGGVSIETGGCGTVRGGGDFPTAPRGLINEYLPNLQVHP
jgi:hypothetical protein